MILENSKLPEGVSISYVSHCKNGVSETGDNGRKCSNISIGDEVRSSVMLRGEHRRSLREANMFKPASPILSDKVFFLVIS